MTQTTGQITLRNIYPEISPDATNWTHIGGTFNALDISGGEVETGEAYTADGSLPLVGVGKAKLTKCKLKVIYTEGAADAWRKFFDAYKNLSDMYFRYSPKGNVSGALRFTSGQGFVTSPVYPQGSVEEAKPVMCELEFTCPGFTDAVIP